MIINVITYFSKSRSCVNYLSKLRPAGAKWLVGLLGMRGVGLDDL